MKGVDAIWMLKKQDHHLVIAGDQLETTCSSGRSSG